MDSSEHDNLLFSVLKDCKTLPIFLDHIFGFLNRRTDFYCVAVEPNAPVGLRPNLAEQIVKNTFFKWKTKDNVIDEEQLPTAAVDEVEIHTTAESRQPRTFTSSECYNGQSFEHYSWSQTLTEVDINVKVPECAFSKDLVINIHADKLSLKLTNGAVLLDGDLCGKCKHNDAIWSFTAGKLEIHLDKCKEVWWNCLVTTEPKLDINNLDCSRPYEELPEEAQAKIEELQWNQERKRLGLPTSDVLKMHETLKKAWDAKGSPFKGPFDPSTVQFQ